MLWVELNSRCVVHRVHSSVAADGGPVVSNALGHWALTDDVEKLREISTVDDKQNIEFKVEKVV